MRVGDTDIVLVQGDLTKEEVDAVVNAANSELLPGGGVCGAIYSAGGPELYAATEVLRSKLGGCPTGDAVCTCGGDLPARFVVHAVGPIWHGGDAGEDELLASCHRRSLEVAAEAGARSIAFPAISTGIYGFPMERAAPIALTAAMEFAAERDEFMEIRFVLFSEGDYRVFAAAGERLSS